MKKILIIGHSHLTALRTASTADATFEFMPCMEKRDGRHVEKKIDHLYEIRGEDYASIVFLMRGNRHIALGMVNHPSSRFDFHLPERPDLPIDSAATLLPVALVEGILKRQMLSELKLTADLVSRFDRAGLYQIETPPPLPSDHIRLYPIPFDEQVELYGVSPLAFRHKFWRLHSKILREHCADLNISFIEVPKEALDRDGSLAEPYWKHDPTHGNALYGDLVLNQIRARHGMEIKKVG